MTNILSISLILVKVLGVILGILVALILSLLLLIWLFPIRYGVTGKVNRDIETLEARVSINWLYKLIYLNIIYSEKTINQEFRIFGLDLNSFLTRKEAKEEVKAESNIERDVNEEVNNSTTPEEKIQFESRINSEEKSETEKSSSEKKRAVRIEEKFTKLKWKFQKFCGMIKRIWVGKEKIQYIFERPIHKRTLENLKIESIYLWNKAKPRRIALNGVVGFEDPSLTGKCMAVLGMLLPVFGEYDIEIQPEFEEQILVLNLDITGKLYLRQILMSVFRIVRDKGNRRTFKVLKRLKL